MKLRMLSGICGAALSLLLASAIVQPARAFTHPCVLLNDADITQLNNRKNTAPYAAGYALFAADSHTQLGYTMQGPFAEVGRNPGFINTGAWRNDMQAVFGLSLQWKFTGNQAYATKARDILLAWANTHKTWSGIEPYLELGDYAHYMCAGASILRSWSGWTAANTTTVKNYFNSVHWPAARSDIPLRSANQGGAHLAASMAIAVYLDDVAKFNITVEAFRANGCAGLRTTQSNGQVGDSGRDMAHAYGELGHYARTAEIAWKAGGIDLFALEGNRLRACGEYWSTFNNGIAVPWIKAGTCYGNYFANDSEGSGPRNQQPEAHHILIGAYVVRKGQAMPQSQTYVNNHADGWKTWLFRKTVDTSTAGAAPSLTFPSTASLTSGLTRAEVGGALPAGSMSNNGNSWTLSGGGTEIWGDSSTDSFTYAYKQVTGDVAMVARVTSLTNTNGSAKAGVMIRESLAADSKMAMHALRPVSGLETSGRGGDAYSHYSNENTHVTLTIPYWVKIERRGNRVTTLNSSDGVNWTPAKVFQFTMSGTYYIGLCVTSKVQGTLTTATFTNVALTGATGGGTLPVAGTYSLKSRTGTLLIDNLNAPNNGDPVGLWADGTSTNQRWNLTYVSANVVKLQCVTNGRYLDGAGLTGVNVGVGQWNLSSSNNQRWTIIATGDGFYKLKNVATGHCVDVGASPWANGDPLLQNAESTNQNQHWQFIAP